MTDLDDITTLLMAFSVVVLVPILIVLALVPAQAYARGHGFLSWLLLEILAFNPIYPLILVALLPNRTRAAARIRYAAELDARLAAHAIQAPS